MDHAPIPDSPAGWPDGPVQLALRGIRKSFQAKAGPVPVLDGLSFDITALLVLKWRPVTP